MQTISNRVSEIKKQLDELESHVNSTITILDCKTIPLNKYPSAYDSYKGFEWRKYNYKWRPTYASEEKTMEMLDTYKNQFEMIHVSNKEAMEQNTKTFNKLCDFFDKLGLSRTTWEYSGSGKNKRSSQVESGWATSLRGQYVMRDTDYEGFTNWYKNEKEEISKFFQAIRTEETQERLKESNRLAEEVASQRNEEEKSKSIALASEFLMSQGKKLDIDFFPDNAIDKAFQLKIELKNKKMEEPEQNIARPESINAINDLEIE